MVKLTLKVELTAKQLAALARLVVFALMVFSI